MPIEPRSEAELVNGGDTRLHYHLEDRGPFPIPHGYFYDTTSQTIASTTTAYPITINTTVFSKGVSIDPLVTSRVVVRSPGIYNIQFSGQLANTDTNPHDAHVWIAKNGVNETESNTIMDVPGRHGGVYGHTVMAWNFFVEMERNDYIELMWSADSTTISMPHFVPAVSPTRPSTPSLILSVSLVSI